VTAGAVKEKETLPAWLQGELPERLDRDLLARAYRFSEKAHEGQKRLSGDKFVSHCVEVAKILVDLQLDTTTVASGLIHDVVEDTAVTVDDIEAEFGKEIAEIVEGLTKIVHLPLNS
jgi:guanosine-3',5'-bis(diphosphate) 3'-pyrophosphohydrolase